MFRIYLVESRDIYSGHFPSPRGKLFVQIKKTGKNLKEEFMKKEREKGEKKKKEKSDKTHVKIPL